MRRAVISSENQRWFCGGRTGGGRSGCCDHGAWRKQRLGECDRRRGKDRQFLDLPGVQQQLLEAVTAVGKPVAVVLYGPGVFAVNWAQEHVSAILQAFMPGQFAAEAVTKVLYGDVNPGGKLTMSVPRSAGQIPVYYNHKTVPVIRAAPIREQVPASSAAVMWTAPATRFISLVMD